jgi:hypothetical protein
VRTARRLSFDTAPAFSIGMFMACKTLVAERYSPMTGGMGRFRANVNLRAKILRNDENLAQG